MNQQKIDLPRVYWKSGAFRLLCDARQKKILGKSWYKLGDTVATAKAEYAKLQEQLSAPTGMGYLFDRYEEEVIPFKKAPRTRQSNLAELKNLRKVFGEMEPEDIMTQHVYTYLDIRGKTSRVQANHELSLLKHIFKYGQRWGFCNINPAAPVEKLALPQRNRYVTDKELQRFCESAGEWHSKCAQFAYLTGLRLSDVLGLKLEQISDAGIKLTASKTGKQFIIVMNDSLRDLIASIKDMNARSGKQGEHLFCTRSGTPYTPDSFHSRWQPGMRRAVAAGVPRFHYHDLRAKHATDLDDQGGDATANLQHSDARTTQAYIRSKKITKVQPLQLKTI